VKIEGTFEAGDDTWDYAACAFRFFVELDGGLSVEQLLGGYVQKGVLTKEEAEKVRESPRLGEALKWAERRSGQRAERVQLRGRASPGSGGALRRDGDEMDREVRARRGG